MENIGQIIGKSNREEHYEYYLSLGYEQKAAAVLALFTYGEYSFGPGELSMDRLYEALLQGEEILPAAERAKRYEPVPVAGTARTSIEDVVGRLSFAARRLIRSIGPMSRRRGPVCGAPLPCSMPEEAFDMYGEAAVPARSALGMPATDEYESIEERGARSTAHEPVSTFRMTTNTASAGIVFNRLRNGCRIDRNMVRIEEMLNYFRYDTELPTDDMFRVSTELMDAQNGKKYLCINVQGRREVRERQNIVLLLDVSGSMSGSREETQAIVATVVSKLKDGDRISLVTYSDNDSVELEGLTVNGPQDRIRVLEKLFSIRIGGCTNGSDGIERAYAIGKRNFIPGGNNQVILITDGDLNFGIADKGGLTDLIERRKKDDLFLSVIGTGLSNFRDDKLEALCKHGNGVYRVVNDLADVKKSIDEEYASLVNVIAKDVKAQVEFNPEIVAEYRLLGFENRELGREDFANDEVISEPFGSGGYGVALYELTMRTGDAPIASGFKYCRLVTTGSRELGTVRIRYKAPLEETSHELEHVIFSPEASYTDDLRLAFTVYVSAEKLRGSDRIGEEELDLARKLYDELGESIREKNAADLPKLAAILSKSAREPGVDFPDEPSP